MNIVSVIFWMLVQMVIVVAAGVVETLNPWMLALAPAPVWETFLIFYVLGNLAWMLVVSIWGEAGELPHVDGRRVRRSLSEKMFPPPPASRHAYASRAKRQRRVIP